MNFFKTTYTNLRNWVQHTYAFTRAEQRAVVGLCAIAIVGLLLNVWLHTRTIQSTMPNLNISYEAVDTSYYKNHKNNYTPNYTNNYEQDQDGTPTTVLAPMDTFNPNTANDNFWLKQAGISSRQLGTLRKFQLRGAVFYAEKDVQKCYAINEKIFARIQPFIRLPKKEYKAFAANYTPTAHETKTYRKTEINQADTTELIALPGIGRTLAGRIVKYRDRLGGFVNTQQLLEVYGLDSSKYNLMINRITLDTYFVSGLLINDISAAELKQHPYFDYNTARIIIMYRNAHGRFKNSADLKNTDVISDELFSKIAPYIRI
ncbi:MAG: helix-hairpin-helix domain-containing protein [Bacteroidia bacterium]